MELLASPYEEDLAGRVRAVLAEHAQLPVSVESLSDDADLYQAGLTSRASVNLMLALESAFDVEFPDQMLRRDVFESIDSICAAIEQLVRPRTQ
jgi:acyl carrier protein